MNTQTATIGGDGSDVRRQCPHCGHSFQASETLAFFLLARGNTIRCSDCRKDSYLRPRRNIGYVLAFVLGAVAGLVVMGLINAIVALATLQPDGSFLIFWWIVLLSIIAGIWAWRAVLKLYNYRTGHFSGDDLYQSVLDFGR